MLCASSHRAWKSREYTVASRTSEWWRRGGKKKKKSPAQVLLERSRRDACSSFRSFFQTQKLLLREARRQEILFQILIAAPQRL